MEYSRRRLLQTTGIAVATAGLAGCNGQSSDETTTAAETDSETETAAETTTENAESSVSVDAAVAVAAEWNAMRARLYDTVALAAAGRLGTAARVTGDVFARFEQSSGEWGAHEQLEATNEQNYETFESHLGGAREAYAAGDAERGSDLAVQAADNLLAAQRGRVDAAVVDALEVLLFGARARDAGLLAAAGEVDAAAELANAVYEDFEDAPAHSSLESASGELYETFEAAVEGAADAGDAETIAASARTAADATVDASYELAPEAVAGAGHLALMQAVGFDAEVLAGLGGPGDEFAHAAALSLYRARAADVPRLVAAGEADFAATVASDVFAHFEGARAHEALEEADHDAYEGFEGGLESLTEAAESGDGAAAEEAVATVDENLLAGISALVGGEAATVLEAAFFRARLGDARELVAVGETDRAAAVGESLFARFEENEANLHESVEEESEELYHRFEEEHLAGLVEDAAAGNADAAAAHAEGAMDALFEFEAAVGATAEVSAAEAAFFGARGFDAAALAQVGASARAGSVVQSTFAFFESGAGGYHETLEEADHDLYESFEGALGSVRTAAEEGGDAYGAAKTYGQRAVDSMYAVVATAAADAGLGAAASERMTGAFQTFEEARVHEALEGGDRDAYEGFEAALSDYVDALADGSEVDAAAEAYATATARAQFAVVGEVGKAPEAGGSEDGGSADAALSGGPNVVEGVPEDADHVVEMSAVAFEPAELTVSAGDTVAFEHVGGEAHSVTAYGDELPEGAAYWASGGFESQEAAETGWSEGKGAVQSGQSYVHTFETAGEHAYYCVPHEAAGMTGTIVVEE
ncbi:DUF5059 domain-containing protein [Haloferax volcanii]|uniref:DUF5059 domain-containing protein n=1 Tax=Haloferax volcanii TaxID=2246 RepID=A0A6C0UT04_HALVO|nr:DUF5059 domain-containing protein [Haloferax alexandrinus]QIB78327.1 DUF5059 domain-containing protein [Haloferax alexandrinus]